MPVILPADVVDDWLNPNANDTIALKGLLLPAAQDTLVVTPASPRVNSVKNDDRSCLVEAGR